MNTSQIEQNIQQFNSIQYGLPCQDATELLCSIFSEAYHPDPIITVSQWADKHRILSQREAEPGRYRTSRTPYLREIMDNLSVISPVQEIAVKKGTQLGFTDAGLNWEGYIIDCAPSRIMHVMPTIADAQRNSKERIAPLIDNCPVLRNKVSDPRSRDSGNTIMQKEFPGGSMIMVGSNSASSLRSTPVRYLFLDEIDAYPMDVGGEGDPVKIAERRTTTYQRKKIYKPSTPTIEGASRIDEDYNRGDKRKFFVPCPHCQEKQVLNFRRENGSYGLRWESEEKRKAIYICEHCGAVIHESHKTWMLSNGEWKPTDVAKKKHMVSYHINSLYAPVGLGLSWTDIMEEWEDAQGDMEKLKTFINTILAECWKESGDAPDWKQIYNRREDYVFGKIPTGGLFLTAGIDIQKDRIEVDIWAWGRNKESWLIENRILMGDTSRGEVWQQLDSILDESWEHSCGSLLSLSKIAIDTGYATNDVYQWCRQKGDSRIVPIKGIDQRTSTIFNHPKPVDVTEKGKVIRRGLNLWTINTHVVKVETYRWLRLERPTDEDLEREDFKGYPAGYIHFPKVDTEYCQQLCAESLRKVEKKTGYIEYQWQKDRERNEALDKRVYARAAAAILGIDRFGESQWRRLESAMQTENASHKNTFQNKVNNIDNDKNQIVENHPTQNELESSSKDNSTRREVIGRETQRPVRRVISSSYLKR